MENKQINPIKIIIVIAISIISIMIVNKFTRRSDEYIINTIEARQNIERMAQENCIKSGGIPDFDSTGTINGCNIK